MLRRCDRDGRGWLHPVLRLLSSRFAVPVPVEVFGGVSFMVDALGAWEALSVLAGREVGVSERPALREIGAFVATFHLASIDVSTGVSARPNGVALRRLLHGQDNATARSAVPTGDVLAPSSTGSSRMPTASATWIYRRAWCMVIPRRSTCSPAVNRRDPSA
jgi:hypothetical protein